MKLFWKYINCFLDCLKLRIENCRCVRKDTSNESERLYVIIAGIISHLEEKKSDIYKFILTGNWGVCATKTVMSRMLSKQYSGLGNEALCRLDLEGLIKLQPIYAYMDGEKYKIANGYLKMVPDDSGASRRAFLSKLAEYEVTVASYLESFIVRSKLEYDPSCDKPVIYTLTRENDIKASTYFFSPFFKEIIESSTLYKERLQVDPSSVLCNPRKDLPIYMNSRGSFCMYLDRQIPKTFLLTDENPFV